MYGWVWVRGRTVRSNIQGKGFGFNKMLHCAFSKETIDFEQTAGMLR